MSLTQGVETFSEAQILRVLEDLKETDDKSNPRTYIPGFLVNVLSPHLPPEKVSSDIEAYSTVLYNAAADPERHLHRLDKAIALIAKCNFRSEESDHVLVQRASQILSRLPARPPLLLAKAWPDGAPDNFPEEYTFPIPCHKSIVDPGPITRWNHLKVVAHVNTAVIRLALHVACSSYDVANITSLLNLYVELLERTSAYSGRAETPRTARYWYVVRAALWTTWQRSMMIFSYQVLQLQIKEGYVDERESLNNSRRMSLATEISVDLVLQKSIENLKENYMCNWAYRLVLNGYISNGLDLRRFHERFRTLYHCRPGRCNATLSCDGKSPESCGRFKGALIIDQSAHNISCSRICGTLYWDESSYRNIRGARAVDIKQTDSQFLRYCEATDETLSISHVWSHGQGGRPESGFNQCLHDRYTSLAKVLNCKSYWMDTPCIPEDHELREEAIANINEVFTKSKATLICDKDLMEIDVAHMTMELRESILVTLLVCDWNVRAWTALEAMRGRKNLLILCKDGNMVSLREILGSVCNSGCIDIAILYNLAGHLLPPRPHPDNEDCCHDCEERISSGHVLIESASNLLSHRQASRSGDDVVIWSLFTSSEVCHDPVDLWINLIGEGKQYIPTSFLVSSAPRIQDRRGLSWAPASPSWQRHTENLQLGIANWTNNTSQGYVTLDGFVAKWLIYKFPGVFEDQASLTDKMLHKVSKQHTWTYSWGALLLPQFRYSHFDYRLNIHSTLTVICASNDGRCWEWRGVCKWEDNIPPPEFHTERILLV